MKKVLITGASSFIGMQLARKMEDRGWQVIAVIRDKRRIVDFSRKTQTLVLSLTDYVYLGDFVGPCDCFVHLAWNGTRGTSRLDAALQQANLEHSIRGVQSMLKAGCKRIVTAGSQAEYGPHAECISEGSSCCPNTEYGKAKLKFYEEAYHLCQSHNVVCIEPRFFSLYGPEDYKDTMIISTLQKLLKNEECPLTQGIQMWDYLHVDDACDALAALCMGEHIPGGVYNFGSGDVRPLKDYILEMDQICGGNGKLRFGAVPYPKTGMVSLWPDVSKLKTTLGWEPRISFEEGIRSILNSMSGEQLL